MPNPANRVASAATPNADCTVLASGITRNWGESFTIDAWGNLTNRTVTKCSADPLSVVALPNNQLSGFGYDAAGNMTSNGGASYSYNAESQLASTGGVTYTYDGDSNRLKKSNGTEYWGAGPLLESDGSGSLQREFIFAGGRRIARRDIASGVVYYYFTDLLGSSDVVTSSAGAIQNESDYFPYGGERIYSQTVTNQNYKFTGKERDGESGLDNFGARYDSSNLGRFMTPDWAARPTAVPYAVFGDPQSLNLYGYVRNDPVSQADADGHEDPPHHGTKAPQGASKCKANVSGPCTDNADGSPDGSPPAKSWWQKAFSYFYVKTGNGRGVGLNNVKVGPGKIDVIFRTNGKDVKQTTQSKTVTTVNSEVGIKVELGPLKLGVERTNTQEEGQPPKTEWVPGYEWGEFKGSNAEVGVGGGGCFILCGQIEVGVQADKVLSDVRDAAASALEPVLTSGK